jgi:uncharacterized protein
MTAPNGPSHPGSPNPELVAQEPSMDDILASIRRIIADDDALPLSRSARAAATAPNLARPASAPPPPVTSSADVLLSLGQKSFRNGESATAAETTTVSTLRPLAPRAATPPTPVLETPKAPTLKLRDFAPSEALGLRPSHGERTGGAEFDGGAKPAAGRGADNAAEPPVAAVANLAEARLKVASPPSRPTPAATAPEAPRSPSLPTASSANGEIPPAAPARPSSRRVSASPPAAVSTSTEESEPALLSTATGARVGASFEALAESLMLRDPHMLERVAREMLRPMLKSWLDDNLPVVVERLVRAEIERIARGRG